MGAGLRALRTDSVPARAPVPCPLALRGVVGTRVAIPEARTLSEQEIQEMPSAQDIMTTDPACVTPSTTVSEAARIMKEHDVGMLPVVESTGSDRLVGVVTDRDIAMRHVAEGHDSSDCPVREAMTRDVTTCSPDDDLKDVMNAMTTEQVRRIPIVDERGSLVGVVAQADVAREADDDDAGNTVEKISEPNGRHAD